MDTVTTRHIEGFIDALPQPEKAIAQKLRDLLFELVPGIEERFSFKLPFYHYYGMFCYLHYDKRGLNLCFCRGKDLVMAFPQLEQKGRAAIASVTLRGLKDVQQLEITQMIVAAAEWNKEAAALKIPLVNRRQN
jgi:hypothetical protein